MLNKPNFDAALVEDQGILRNAYEMFLRESQEVSSLISFDCAEDFLAELPESLDLLLTDIELPGISGLELARTVRHLRPELKIIITTVHQEFFYLEQALNIPVDGYVVKQEDFFCHSRALAFVKKGDVYISPQMHKVMVKHLVFEQNKGKLTERENQIFRALKAGASAKEIACQYDLSKSSVYRFIKRIEKKVKLDFKGRN